MWPDGAGKVSRDISVDGCACRTYSLVIPPLIKLVMLRKRAESMKRLINFMFDRLILVCELTFVCCIVVRFIYIASNCEILLGICFYGSI